MKELTVDESEQRLDGYATRSLPMPDWLSLGVGLLLIGMATVMELVLVSLMVFAEQRGLTVFHLIIPVVGAGLGIPFAVYGWRSLRRRARSKEQAALHPDEPWHADWTWDADGVREDAQSNALPALVTV